MKRIALILLVNLICYSWLGGQVNLTDSNLPIIIIETNNQSIQDEPKITANMKIIDNGPDNRNQITDTPQAYEGFIGIEFRGATSQSFPKKGYGLETRKEDGSNLNVELFGMSKENDWVLHGPFSDKSLIRNALAYKLAGRIMTYAPRTQFCELMINGNYQGVYLFTEKLKIDKGRVNIDKLKVDEIAGDELTGGYLIKIDKTVGGATDGWFSSFPPMLDAEQRTYYQYHDPSFDEMDEIQRNYIRDYITSFEEVMASENFADDLNGYRNYINVESFIDYMLVNEICKNVDAYRLSTYFYKDKNSVDPLITAGPVWDFNLGFGNVDFCAGPSPQGWVLDYNSICPWDGYLIQFWWLKLLEDNNFGTQLVDRWREIRINEWSDSHIEACIDSLVESINEGQMRNFNQWSILGEYVWPNSFIGNSHIEEIAQLRSWLTDRLEWMDRSIEQLNRSQTRVSNGTVANVFPNPFLETLTFEVFGLSNQQVEIEVYNSLGQLIFLEETKILASGKVDVFWTPELESTEFYFFRILINGKESENGVIFRG